MEQLWDLEQAGWEALSGGDPRAFYERTLTDDAVMIVPGQVLDTLSALRSWDRAAPWQNYELAEECVRQLAPDVVALTYRATARRSDQPRPYRATMTSVYVRRAEGWRLALHQQTPTPMPGSSG
jgi:uncharacterized protein (TIGR02246 family)